MGVGYLQLDGVSGGYVSTPTAAALQITGPIDVRCRAALDSWTPSTTPILVAKDSTSGSNRAWVLQVLATGRLRFFWWNAGGTLTTIDSTASVPAADGAAIWLRVTLLVDDGNNQHVVTFYTSEDGLNWVQLGAAITTAGTTTIRSESSAATIGARGTAGTSGMAAGKVYAIEIRSGIGGTVVANPDFTGWPANVRAFRGSTGNVWTIHGTAEIVANTQPTPTLAVTDNADGTGAVATISGTRGDGANTVRVYPFGGPAGIGESETFTRTGNGTVALSLAVGTYFAELVSDDYAAMAPVFFAVTDDETCLWDRILAAVVAKIQSLPLTGITADNVRLGKLPIKYADIGPVGVLVSPMRETITPAGNVSDHLGYGCLVSCFKASNGNNASGLGQELKWRDQIATAFKIKPAYNPIDVPEVFNITIEPGSVVLPEAFLQANYDVGALVLRVFAKQHR